MQHDHLKFTKRIYYATLLVNFALIVTCLLALYAVWRVHDLSRLAIADRAQDLFQSQRLSLALERAVASDRAYLITGNPRFLTEVTAHQDRFDELALGLGERLERQADKQLLERAQAANRLRVEALQKVYGLRAGAESLNDLGRQFETEVRPHTLRVRELLGAIVTQQEHLLQTAADETVGTSRFLLWTVLALSISDLIFGIVITLMIRRTLGQLSTYSTDLQRAVTARDDFLAAASHELRTPLAVLKLHAQMMGKRTADQNAMVPQDDIREFASRVNYSVHSMATLVNRMLDVAHLDRGGLRLHIEEVELRPLAAQVVDQVRPLFNDARCELTIDAPEAVSGSWDRQRLEQVLLHLLTNVARHSDASQAVLRMRCDRKRARIEVEDNGSGIDEADRPHIFTRFARQTMAPDGTGMGLGMAAAKEIVEAQGGSIRFEPVTPHGSLFIVELPLQAS